MRVTMGGPPAVSGSRSDLSGGKGLFPKAKSCHSHSYYLWSFMR